MKLWQSAKLKIVAATSMVIFTLFACFAGSIAWFNTVQNVSNGGNNIPVANITSCLTSVTFHAQVGTSTVSEKNYYLFEKAPYATISINGNNSASALTFNTDSGAYKDWQAREDKTASLSTYSLLSQDHPILLLFNLVSYTAEDPRAIQLSFSTESGYLGFADAITQSGNPLSSIVEFNAFGLTSALPFGGSYTSSTQTYSATYRYGEVRGINYDKKWASIDDNGTATYDDDGLIELFTNLDADGNPSSTVYTQIGVVMNYSSASLQYIYNRFLGNEVLENNLFFNWDWTMEL